MAWDGLGSGGLESSRYSMTIPFAERFLDSKRLAPNHQLTMLKWPAS